MNKLNLDTIVIFLIALQGLIWIIKYIWFIINPDNLIKMKLISIKRDWDYNWDWINLIWSHRRKMKSSPHAATLMQTNFWDCVKATIALLLNRWYYPGQKPTGVYIEDPYLNEYPEIAWQDVGNYSTDYGVGYAWISLHIMPGLKVLITENGSL